MTRASRSGSPPALKRRRTRPSPRSKTSEARPAAMSFTTADSVRRSLDSQHARLFELRGREPEGARFCDSCGAPLSSAVPARESRKIVTVLFCDVTGSTALGERIDPESLRNVMARYFETAKEAIERHGGT